MPLITFALKQNRLLLRQKRVTSEDIKVLKSKHKNLQSEFERYGEI